MLHLILNCEKDASSHIEHLDQLLSKTTIDTKEVKLPEPLLSKSWQLGMLRETLSH